jgi:hypothetical protein
MDGPVFVPLIWVLCVAWIWVYRRYFETVTAPEPEFEQRCAAQPVLASVTVREGQEAAVATKLQALIGKRNEVVATFGRNPWPHYVLGVELLREPGRVHVRARAARVKRSGETPPAFSDVLLALMRDARGAATDCWLNAETYSDMTHRLTAPKGWRLLSNSAQKFPFEPWSNGPEENLRASP